MTKPDWDAAAYDRFADPQFSWGLEVLDRLTLRGDEVVLDAGCGSGRVTLALLDRLPRGRVIAVDSSPAMVEKAADALASRATVRLRDLSELVLDEPVDAVFSNAVFHWVRDHDRLFRRLHAALRPGGRLIAQCGGEGNVARLREAADAVRREPPFARYADGWEDPWRFDSPEEAESSLARAGFAEVECWLEAKPVVPSQPREFLRASQPGSYTGHLPPALREEFVERLVTRLGDPPELDYVRLNISARRGP